MTVLLGIFLGLQQGLAIDDIELDVVSVEAEITSDELNEFVESFAFEHLGVEFHIQECAACSGVVEFSCGFEDGGWAFGIGSLAG